MFDRFSDDARKSMALARQAAQHFQHDYIGTEHMLLGVIELEHGIAVRALTQLGIDAGRVRARVNDIVKPGTRDPVWGQIPFTPRGKTVLEGSLEAAQAAGHRHIGTGHLLLGLLMENEGIAAQVLTRLGLTADKARPVVLQLIDEDGSANDGPPEDAMFHRFSEDARGAMKSAAEAVKRFRHDRIGTEHLLLGAIELRRSVAAGVLKRFGVDDGGVRTEVTRRVKVGVHDAKSGQLPFTPRASKVLQAAIEEAQTAGHRHVGTGHLLLGLLREADGAAAQVLTEFGLTADKARPVVEELVSGKDFLRDGPPI